MANQITIDIVAETKKLTSGINDANSQIDGMSSKLKGAAAAAGAAASAFVLKQGITFLKQGIDEAKEATETMRAATTTFGEGSAALAKITEDADKFGKAIAVDNDVIIQLATQLGSRLPADSKAASAELVNLAYDISAYTGGAVSADAVTGKLAKAFADGTLTAKEMTKIFPDLSASTYAQAEALSKAGDNQGALNILIEAGQKKYGDAAENNVTASQKFEVALANLKETIGLKILPFIEKLVDFLTLLIEKFDSQPDLIKNIELAFIALVAIGGPLLGFIASTQAALVTLGVIQSGQTLTTGLATIATNLFSFALKALPFVAIIALIVLFVKNFDTIRSIAEKVGVAIANFGKNAYEKFRNFKEDVVKFISDVIDKFEQIPGQMITIGINIAKGLWRGIADMGDWLKDKLTTFFGNLIPDWAKKPLGIKSPSRVFMDIGKNIVLGLTEGITDNSGVVRNATQGLALSTTGINVPRLRSATGTANSVAITINAGAGTDPYSLGRAVKLALGKYNTISK